MTHLLLIAALWAPPVCQGPDAVHAWLDKISVRKPLHNVHSRGPLATVSASHLRPAEMAPVYLEIDAKDGLTIMGQASGRSVLPSPKGDPRAVLTIRPDARVEQIVEAFERLHRKGYIQAVLVVQTDPLRGIPPTLNVELTRKIQARDEALLTVGPAERMEHLGNALVKASGQCKWLHWATEAVMTPTVPAAERMSSVYDLVRSAVHECPLTTVRDYTAVIAATVPKNLASGVNLELDPEALVLSIPRGTPWRLFATQVAARDRLGAFWLVAK